MAEMRRRPAAGMRRTALTNLQRGALLASIIFLSACEQQVATASQPASVPAKPLDCAAQHLIPVAKETGVACMTQSQYDAYVQPMRPLPVMPRAYVFGRTIPLPKTDQYGHIQVTDATAPLEQHR
jgi:hypothetical protein